MNKRLILQDPSSNINKFYYMDQTEDTWVATYGRIGRTGTKCVYPLSEWNAKYKEKIRKGYIDVTDNNFMVGSAVLTPDNTLWIVTDVESYYSNIPKMVSIENNKGGRTIAFVDRLTPGYINPELITHQAFYKHLIELHNAIKNSTYGNTNIRESVAFQKQ